MVTNAFIYRAAAFRVLEGWTQGRHRDAAGKACMVHAVYEVTGTPVNARLPYGLEDELHAYLMRRPGFFLVNFLSARSAGKMAVVVLWNDLPWRTPEDVVDVFLSLADQLDRLPPTEIPPAV